jgi:Icc-related predicted phosphoesterase
MDLQRFNTHPIKTRDSAIRVVCISDTHNAQPSVPPGDVLIHAGDLTQNGTAEELHAVVSWISSLPHPIKIVVAGNHDKILDVNYRTRELLDSPEINWESSGIIYLEHTATQITTHERKITVFGSPYTPEYGNWAFQYPPTTLLPERAREIWAAIPLHTDILITHGPPFAHLDVAGTQHAGCRGLLGGIWVVRPALHVFGHIHAGRGRETLLWDAAQKRLECVSANKGVSSRLLDRTWSIMEWAKRKGGTRRTSLLVNACIQPGGRTDLFNDAEVVFL